MHKVVRRAGWAAGIGVAALVGGRLVRGRAKPPAPRSGHYLGGTWTPGPAAYDVGIRHNVPIRMSDGVTLRADVHYPVDPRTGQAAEGPFPTLMTITPYGKKAPPPADKLGAGAIHYLVKRGYIEALVDVRGTGASGGEFEMLGERQVQDGRELVEWAAGLDNASGAVGMFGTSYLAINQLLIAGAVGRESPLKAIFPALAATDFYRDAAGMGGVPHMPLVRGYGELYRLLNVVNPMMEALTPGGHDRPRAGGLAAVRDRGRAQRAYFAKMIGDVLEGGETGYDGDFWAAMRPADVLDRIVANDIAVFLVGGWNDAFQRGAPLNYSGLQNAHAGRDQYAPMTADQPVSGKFQLLMGPWYHVTDFPGVHMHALQLRWFDRWLKGIETGIDDTGTPLHMYEVGGGRWLHTRAFPLFEAEPTRLYLLRDGGLSTEPAETVGADTLRYRPRGAPAGRSWEQWTLGAYGFAASRRGRPIKYDLDNRRIQKDGVLTYSTEPLDRDQTIAGPVGVTLHATATTRETLWVVHLDDVAPDGTSKPLSTGALLGSFRELDEKRTWYAPDGGVLLPFHPCTKESVQEVTPGAVTRYDIEVYPIAARIAAGHRIRITVATSDFPNLAPGRLRRPLLAGGVYRIQRGGAYASYVTIPLADPEKFAEED